MSSIFSDGALHPGRDPNDSSWQILRQPNDFTVPDKALFTDAVYDPGRKVIELAPHGLAPGAADSLEVTASDGTVYRSDPDQDLVLRRGPCDADWVRLPHFGGRGTTTGRLQRPQGLALDDRGLLYVADADNHRVQVVRPEDGSVVVVLGCADGWGAGVAGVDHGAMTEPVSVAVGKTAIYIADHAGHAVHIFDRSFRWLRAFSPSPQPTPVGFTSSPVAIGVDAADELLVADAAWPLLLRFSPAGTQLPDLAYSDPAVPASLHDLAALARFAASGEVIVKLDGLVEDLAWHRVIVDARIPAGARIEVQTFASDDGTWPPQFPWAPAAPVAMPDVGDAHDGPLGRPVLSDVGRWARERHGEYVRARPVIASYAGDGPNGVAALVLSGDGLARVRAGDVIQLTAAAPSTASELVVVASVPARTVQLSAAGTVGLFVHPTDIVLLERDGVEPFAGPRTLYSLDTGESIDLSAVNTDGTLAEVQVPHGAAAMWRRGDVIQIGTATILVDDVRTEPVIVPLASVPGADYSTSIAQLAVSVGRLFVADATGLDAYVPPDEPITLVGITAGSPWTKPEAIHWVEPELGAVWLAPDPMLAWADWEEFTTQPGKATDRGQFLWVRLHLVGATAHPDDPDAIATPTIRSIRVVRPRLSYLRYLPATYARRDGDDPTGALFLERMLGLFEHQLTKIESRYESVTRELDPFAADPEWLKFLAAWFDLYLDPALPLDRKRLLVAEANALYAIRGTPEGIRRYVEIVTGETPTIIEGFQLRPGSGLILGSSGVLGCTALGGLDENTATSTAFLDRYAHRFTLIVFVLDPCQIEQVRASIQQVIDSIRPAHTLVDLRVITPAASVGYQSTIGVDFVVGDDRTVPHVLGEPGEFGGRPHPVLGLDAVLVPSGDPALVADDVGVRIDGDLSLR